MDDITHHTARPPEGGGNATATFFVSLYLVVLAFFILLNSIASREAVKEGKAVGSVKEAFAPTNIDLDQPGIQYELPNGPAETAFDHYYGQVSQSVSLLKNTMYTEGNQFYVVIPIKQLFGVGVPTVLARQRAFLDNLAAVLRDSKDDTALDMEVLVGSATYLQGGDNRLDILRAGAIVREMRSRYVRREQLSVGLTPVHPDVVVLSFVPRGVEDVRLDLPEGW